MSEGPFRSPHLVARAAKPNDHIPVLVQRIGSWRLSIEREPLSAEALRRRYGARAGSYSQRLRRLGYTEAYAKLAQRLAGPAPDALAAGARVLDCGVGSGALSLAVASAASGPLRHHLLDISPTMLQVARDALASRGVRSEAVPADLRSIPYPDARFDVVMAAHAIEHLADPIEALREMHRVTRPGGCALVVVTRRSPFGRLIHLFWRVHCATGEQLRDWLERAGWNGVQALPLGGPWWCDRMSIACIARKMA